MWDQSVGSGEAISTYRFAALVDGVRAELPGAGCVAAAEALYACSSGLPPMSAGPHSLRLIAINGALESPPSTPPLSLVVVTGQSSTAPASSRDTAANDTRVTTADGVNLRLETLAGGLTDVTDVAPAPGGTFFVAERAGTIRLYRDALVQPAPAAAMDDTIAAGGELLAVAVDPGFSANRWIYALHTTARFAVTPGLFEFRITRLTALDDSFSERVTVLAGVAAASARSAAALRFGPDGKLYAAFDDGGSELAPNDLASFNGKVLRLEPDGTTPADQPAATPVLAGGFQAPRKLAWSEDGGVLWVFQSRSDGSERMTPVRIERRLGAAPQAPYDAAASVRHRWRRALLGVARPRVQGESVRRRRAGALSAPPAIRSGGSAHRGIHRTTAPGPRRRHPRRHRGHRRRDLPGDVHVTPPPRAAAVRFRPGRRHSARSALGTPRQRDLRAGDLGKRERPPGCPDGLSVNPGLGARAHRPPMPRASASDGATRGRHRRGRCPAE